MADEPASKREAHMPISDEATPEWWAVFSYSEWLDGEKKLLVPPDDDDERTHQHLVDEFMAGYRRRHREE